MARNADLYLGTFEARVGLLFPPGRLVWGQGSA